MDGPRINCQPGSKCFSLAEEMGGEGGGGTRLTNVLVCRLIGKDSKRNCLKHLTQNRTRQLLKFDLSLVHRFRLRYSTTCDSYYRDWFDAIDPSSKGVIPGWDKAIFSVDNVHRHLNEDVGQVTQPLAEFILETTGHPSWRFLSVRLLIFTGRYIANQLMTSSLLVRYKSSIS